MLAPISSSARAAETFEMLLDGVGGGTFGAVRLRRYLLPFVQTTAAVTQFALAGSLVCLPARLLRSTLLMARALLA